MAEPEGSGTSSDEGSGGEQAEVDPAVAEALAQLPAEDRALAEKQKICPVSDEPLGSMGVPVKVTVEGRDVFLCCESCEGMLKENPEEYLAKLK
jgi:hypothetical protein